MVHEKESGDGVCVLEAGTVVVVNGVSYSLCADVDADPTVPKVVYPRLLWSPSGQEVTVKDKDEEDVKLAEGYRFQMEPNAPAVDVFDNSPTFGPPDDDTFGEDVQVEDHPKKKKK